MILELKSSIQLGPKQTTPFFSIEIVLLVFSDHRLFSEEKTS